MRDIVPVNTQGQSLATQIIEKNRHPRPHTLGGAQTFADVYKAPHYEPRHTTSVEGAKNAPAEKAGCVIEIDDD